MSDEERREFPSNDYTKIKPIGALPEGSSAPVEARPKRQKSTARERKMTLGERLVNNFTSINYKEVGERLIVDWFFPEVINTIDNFLRQVFFGNRNAANGRGQSVNKDRLSRVKYYNSLTDGAREPRTTGGITRRNFRRIVLEFDTKQEALDILDEVREALAMSNATIPFVTVRELYNAAQMPTDATMYKWGWYDLEDVNVVDYGDYAALEMPPAVDIRGGEM